MVEYEPGNGLGAGIHETTGVDSSASVLWRACRGLASGVEKAPLA